MGKCFRHFKALTRKNWLLWKRNWGCSGFELLAPCILMIGLTIIRMQIPTTHVDQAGMLEKKFPAYIGVAPTGMNTWAKNT
jgi:ATP-binding cassette subfamily A (ABC1) protein 3